MSQIEQLKLAIQRDRANPKLHYDLGGLYLASMQMDAAMESYKEALQLAPNHPQILLQLGNTASTANRFTLAVDYFKQCIQVSDHNAAAYYNLGNALRELGQLNEAASSFQLALKFTPHDADAHNNLGNVYRELGELDKTIDCYETALKCNPKLFHALAHLIHQKQHMCDWIGLNDQITQLRKIVKNHPEAQVAPFAFLAMPNTSPEEQLLCATQWANQQYSSLTTIRDQLNFSFQSTPLKKIKIAYLSADFRLHPLAFLITELLENHNRTQFEIYAYSYGPDDQSEERQRIKDAVDHFIEIQSFNDIEAATHIHQQEIDILVDLTGYTKGSRTGIVALKPAPISINWLGYPGTMGMINGQSLFDYMIVDEIIGANTHHFSEKCILLPCYQPNNSSRPIGDAGSRAQHHLADNAFVFCCFNQTFKINAEIFATWMHILKQVPHSVLWLLDCNPWAKQNLIKQAQQAGIAPERIIFAPRTSIANHLARHQFVDLFLDTLPYNAHTTASDALWMGVPIVTCLGDTFPSRVAASLLNTTCIKELIVNSLVEYEQLSIDLAMNPEKLNYFKQTLEANKDKLFNNRGYVEALESKYNKIHHNLLNKKI